MKRRQPWRVTVIVRFRRSNAYSVGEGGFSRTWPSAFRFEARERFERFARGDVLELLAAVRPSNWHRIRDDEQTELLETVVSWGSYHSEYGSVTIAAEPTEVVR